MIGDVLYGSAENVEVKLLDFMTEIKASEFIGQVRGRRKTEKKSSYEQENFSSNLNSECRCKTRLRL